MLRQQAEHSGKAHETKILEKKRLLNRLRKQVKERTKENEALDLQLNQLQMQVADKQTIFNLQGM